MHGFKLLYIINIFVPENYVIVVKRSRIIKQKIKETYYVTIILPRYFYFP